MDKEVNSSANFYAEEMRLLGVNEENNKFELINLEAEPPIPKRQLRKIFSQDKKGNIQIAFWNLRREIPTFYINKTGNPREWRQTRLKEPKGDMKYQTPAGEGTYPWLGPKITLWYEERKVLKTLFITEGAKKAMKAQIHGVPCIGLTSITHYRDRETGQLQSDILEIIKTCKVQNLVVLWDGDCRDISEKALERVEELTKRPETFLNSLCRIRALVIEADLGINIYFSHVKRNAFASQPKGLDDILIAGEKEDALEPILNDLYSLADGKNFYFKKIGSKTGMNELKEYFCLTDVGQFYDKHSGKIGLKEFVFNGSVYQFDGAELEERMPLWTRKIKRVGDYFFEVVPTMDARGEITGQNLVKISSGALSIDYGKGWQKYFKGKRYLGFCNVPANYDDYQEQVKGYLNRYSRLNWMPKEGSIENIKKMIRHTFGTGQIEHNGQEIDRIDLGLDYCQLLLTKPIQKLPVLVLYSPERNTGKSTFPLFMKKVLGANAIKVGNKDFNSNHNEVFADKLLIYCEETLLDKRSQSEMIKDLATSEHITVNPKNRDMYELNFFAKFIFTSNNSRMIYVDKRSERFWIIRVPPFKEVEVDFLKNKLLPEIPAFLHLLKERKLVTKRESRMHFHRDLILTDAFHRTAELYENPDVAHLRECIGELFDIEKNGDEILIDRRTLIDQFFNGNKTLNWIKEVLTDRLEVDHLRDEHGNVIVKRSTFYRLLNDNIYPINVRGRLYVFKREDFAIKEKIT